MKQNDPWSRKLLFLLFPPKCVGCGELQSVQEGMSRVFCPFCQTKWEAGRLPTSQSAAPRTNSRYELVSVVGYVSGETEGVAEKLIYHLKHKDEKRVFDFAAREMAGALRAASVLEDISPEDVLVTYPPRRTRAVRKEGFDQAKRLAQALAKAEGYTCRPLLERVGWEREQKRLNAARRQKNAEKAYALAAKTLNLSGKTVILVDDLCTTGATLISCADLLAAAGADRVILSTVGRTIS